MAWPLTCRLFCTTPEERRRTWRWSRRRDSRRPRWWPGTRRTADSLPQGVGQLRVHLGRLVLPPVAKKPVQLSRPSATYRPSRLKTMVALSWCAQRRPERPDLGIGAEEKAVAARSLRPQSKSSSQVDHPWPRNAAPFSSAAITSPRSPFPEDRATPLIAQCGAIPLTGLYQKAGEVPHPDPGTPFD